MFRLQKDCDERVKNNWLHGIMRTVSSFQLWYRVTRLKISMSKSRMLSRSSLDPPFGCHPKTSCDGALCPPLGPCPLVIPIEWAVLPYHTRQQCPQSDFPWLQWFAVTKECQTAVCEVSRCKKLWIQEWEVRPTWRRVAMMTYQPGSGGGKSDNPKSQWLPLS